MTDEELIRGVVYALVVVSVVALIVWRRSRDWFPVGVVSMVGGFSVQLWAHEHPAVSLVAHVLFFGGFIVLLRSRLSNLDRFVNRVELRIMDAWDAEGDESEAAISYEHSIIILNDVLSEEKR